MNDIERSLRDLGAHIETPATPDLVTSVLPTLSPAPQRQPSAMRWRGSLVAAAAVAAVLLVVAVVPASRDRVISWLGIEGVTVRSGSTLLGADLDIGQNTTLEGAADVVGFEPLIPASLGAPNAVYVDAESRVWLLYEATAGLPETALAGVGAIVTQFRPDVSPGITKELLASPNAEALTVNGGFAIWIEGPHNVILDGLEGSTVNGRSAGNTLLWEGPEITLRLETALPLEDAVAIARSFD